MCAKFCGAAKYVALPLDISAVPLGIIVVPFVEEGNAVLIALFKTDALFSSFKKGVENGSVLAAFSRSDCVFCDIWFIAGCIIPAGSY